MNQNIFTTDDEQGIVDHINDDHSNSLVHYCHLLGMSQITETDMVVMTGIDQDGFELEVNGENVRYELEKPMKEPREVRKVMVTLDQESITRNIKFICFRGRLDAKKSSKRYF